MIQVSYFPPLMQRGEEAECIKMTPDQSWLSVWPNSVPEELLFLLIPPTFWPADSSCLRVQACPRGGQFLSFWHLNSHMRLIAAPLHDSLPWCWVLKKESIMHRLVDMHILWLQRIRFLLMWFKVGLLEWALNLKYVTIKIQLSRPVDVKSLFFKV